MLELLGKHWIRAAALAGVGLIAPLGGMRAVADDAPELPEKPDPELGYRLLLTKPMAAPVMKVTDIERIWQVWEPEEKAKAEAASPEERRKMTFTRYGWAYRPGDPTGLPLDYTEDGKGNLVTNCFSCHGGKVAGNTLPGGGNTHFDLTAVATDVMKLKLFDTGRDYSAAKDMVLPYGAPLNWSRGNSNAVIFAPVLAAMRDKDLNISQMRNPGQLDNHDMNAPAWWNVSKKTKLYCDGFAPHTVRQIMPFAMSPTISGEELRSFEPAFTHIIAYIDSLKAPKYPYAVDDKLAAKGKDLFETSCSGCHGTYGADAKFPQKIVPLSKVKTDPIRLTAIKYEKRVEANQGWFQYYGEHPVELESKGYMAPVLNGVWATAPYLHNGAIPTLAALFDSSKRPKVWKRDEDGYDQKSVGVVYEALDAVPAGLNGRQSRQYYDTTSVSHSAEGHTFPEELLDTPEDKLAVIEYLKTL